MATYCTAAEIKAEINLTDTAGQWTTWLTLLAQAASKVIDNFCNRQDGFDAIAVATERVYVGRGTPYCHIDECVQVTSVAVKDSSSDTTYTAWTAPTTNLAGDGDWIAAAGSYKTPNYNTLPYTLLIVDPNGDEATFTDGRYTGLRGFRPTSDVVRGIPTVKVTARWGYSDLTPDPIKEAAIMQAARWFKRLQGSMADSLAAPEFGELMFRRVLDPDIQLILVSARFVKPMMQTGGQ
jgi:hypothetical protein